MSLDKDNLKSKCKNPSQTCSQVIVNGSKFPTAHVYHEFSLF